MVTAWHMFALFFVLKRSLTNIKLVTARPTMFTATLRLPTGDMQQVVVKFSQRCRVCTVHCQRGGGSVLSGVGERGGGAGRWLYWGLKMQFTC